ncbi:hypothetical protein NQ318_021055 [Aromia moschata]|uniref:Uncharacterized protein n=1 Tax=Aromia moschata TaxID=1265417 RepID=A0AAV8YAU8_9CUCU|nr:hypothetical protein NQ318_021055 [Aromia moschata]
MTIEIHLLQKGFIVKKIVSKVCEKNFQKHWSTPWVVSNALWNICSIFFFHNLETNIRRRFSICYKIFFVSKSYGLLILGNKIQHRFDYTSNVNITIINAMNALAGTNCFALRDGGGKMEIISRVLIKAGAKRVAKDLKGRQPTYYFLNKSEILRLQEGRGNILNRKAENLNIFLVLKMWYCVFLQYRF